MVKKSYLFIVFFVWTFLFNHLIGVDNSISVAVKSETASENTPVECLVTIIRDEGKDIDESSFIMADEKLDVEFIGDSYQSSVTIINGLRTEKRIVISNYRFQIEGKAKGTYKLPSIQVSVGGKQLSSHPNIYYIEGGVSSNHFLLEAFVNGGDEVYPGQKLELGYRIYNIKEIDLTAQDLPLLEAQGFKRIGEKNGITYRSGQYTVQEWKQVVEAASPGTVSFGPSLIEGFAYEVDFFGRKTYVKPRLRAEANGLRVEVLAFPEENRPENFSGMLGDYSLDVSLLSKAEARVGDKLELKVVISGEGEFSTIKLLNFSSFSGFAEDFRFGDLPPAGQEVNSSLIYHQELRPLSSSVTSIPPLELACFNPITRQYYSLRSKPIPIRVLASEMPKEVLSQEIQSQKEDRAEVSEGALSEKLTWRSAYEELDAIEIFGNYRLAVEDFEPEREWPLVFIIFAGIGTLFLQTGTLRYMQKKRETPKKETSGDIFKRASKMRGEEKEFFSVLQQAMILKLFERGFLAEDLHSINDLPSDGVCGQVRGFFLALEERRFSGIMDVKKIEVIREAKKIFTLIGKGSR
ncbi:MAG: hypothetical protein ACI9S8_001546 [Chlamydiales bacterium]|jgi:hypothetical protein